MSAVMPGRIDGEIGENEKGNLSGVVAWLGRETVLLAGSIDRERQKRFLGLD